MPSSALSPKRPEMRIRNFIRYAERREGDECWPWRGHIDNQGYGQLGGELAHRFSFRHFRGPIPWNRLGRHRCHNRACVNPAHLLLGTHADNMRDLALKQVSVPLISNGSQRVRRTKHERSRTPEYAAWVSMRQRCTNPNAVRYPEYGGRGIHICDEWRAFDQFFRDMGPRPSPHHSLARIDNDGPYTRENCSWALAADQMRNTSYTRRVTFNNETLCARDWAVRVGLHPRTLLSRLLHGWSVERALVTPLNLQYRHARKSKST